MYDLINYNYKPYFVTTLYKSIKMESVDESD